MGIFNIFKKKKELQLPEPPEPAEGAQLRGDFPNIKGTDIQNDSKEYETPIIPQPPSNEYQTPEEELQPPVSSSQSPVIQEKSITYQPPIESKIKTRPIGQVYISINDYQTIIKNVQAMQEAIQTSQEQIAQAEHVKEQGEHELEAWKKQLEDIERKLNYADQTIAKAGAP